jgi:hypothetical protein
VKSTLRKIYFGYITLSSLLTLIVAPLSAVLRFGWYREWVSPAYFLGESLAAGLITGAPEYSLPALLLLIALCVGGLMGLIGERKWAAALILPILGGLSLLPLLYLLLLAATGAWGFTISYVLSLVINIALLILYIPLFEEF